MPLTRSHAGSPRQGGEEPGTAPGPDPECRQAAGAQRSRWCRKRRQHSEGWETGTESRWGTAPASHIGPLSPKGRKCMEEENCARGNTNADVMGTAHGFLSLRVKFRNNI